MTTPNEMLATDKALNLDLDDIRVIEASAGTGKTFTIAGLYVRLIVERQVDVSGVLVMTFTRAATAELKHRLRKRLRLCAEKAAADAAHPDAPDAPGADVDETWVLALLRRVRARGEETPEGLAARLRRNALHMDQAAIFTIHGFCSHVLKSWSVLLDDAVAGMQLGRTDRELLEAYAHDAWVRVAGEDDPLKRAALQALGDSPEKLAATLDSMLGFDGQLEPTGAIPAVTQVPDLDAGREALFAAWRAHGREAVAVFDEYFHAGALNKNSYRTGKAKSLRDLAEQLVQRIEPATKTLQNFRLEKLRKAVKKGHDPFPEQAAFAAIDDWLDLNLQHEKAVKAQIPALLEELAGDAQQWLAVRKRELLWMSYDDLIAHLEHGLQHSKRRDRLIHTLRQQYPYALIDEFQDTSLQQFRVFETVYGEVGGLCLIGDPKQAIYGFRGGDVHAYLRAVDTLTDKPPEHLEVNHRSSKRLLDAVAAVFGATDNPFLNPGIGFEPVTASGDVSEDGLALDGATVPALTFWPDSGQRDADTQRAAMAEACAVRLVQLLDPTRTTLEGAALKPGQCAVLVNTNNEAMLVQDTLAAHGVPAVCRRRESLYTSREAYDLLQIMDALLTPASLRLARGALTTGLLGVRLSALTAADATPVTDMDELSRLRQRWFRHGLLAMLESLAEQHAARLLDAADGERRLANLLHLGEALQADARRLTGEQALRDRLAERIRDADDRNEEEQLRLESDAERVQILTLHAAKGLEFDVVMMPYAASMGDKPPAKNGFVDFHRGDERIKRLILSDSGARQKSDADAAVRDDQLACDAAAGESTAEHIRCFYVGLTRARHACWVGSGGGVVLNHVLAADSSGANLADGDVIACEPPPGDASARLRPHTAQQRVAVRAFTGRLRRDWWRHSFSALTRGDEHTADTPAADEAGAADVGVSGAAADPMATVSADVPVWPRGARYGNAVHAVLEQCDMAAWKHPEPPREQQQVIAHALRGAGYAAQPNSQAYTATVQLVRQTLATPIVDGTALADIAPADCRAEMAFHFGMAGVELDAVLTCLHEHGYQRDREGFAGQSGRLRGLMTGFIDLVFRHDDKWWIVDYKTNHLGPHRDAYTPENVARAVADNDYDLQYLIYTVALHRWLRLMQGDAYDYDRDIGGVRYLFLRGMDPDSGADYGIHADKPPRVLIESLDELLQAQREELA